MSAIDPNSLPLWGRIVSVWIRGLGAILLAILVTGFLLGQKAGWIPDVERDTHEWLKSETRMQTVVLKDNQSILNRQLELMERNQKAQMRLTRGLCISVTKTSDAERRCLGDD